MARDRVKIGSAARQRDSGVNGDGGYPALTGVRLSPLDRAIAAPGRYGTSMEIQLHTPWHGSAPGQQGPW